MTVDENPDESRPFVNFILNLRPVQAPEICSSTENCTYFSKQDNIRRHEKLCSGEVQVKDKQIAYGKNTSVIKRLVQMKILPEEALGYRKRFIVTYDIETIGNGFEIMGIVSCFLFLCKL